MKILLLQARDADDPILEHEFACFVERSGVGAQAFQSVNLAECDDIGPGLYRDVDMIMMGGSGDYSVVKAGFDWLEPMLELMRSIVADRKPMFASCFGFQALVAAMGGVLRTDPAHAELGTFSIQVTDRGAQDALFGPMSPSFDAQLGHNDSVVEMPPGLVCLARSERCSVQAVRVPGAPIVATQFHPELTDRDNIRRYLRYLEAYKQPGESMEQARERAEQMHRPSPRANALIAKFVRLHTP